MEQVVICGIPIASLTQEEAVSELQSRLRARRQTAVFTPNGEMMQHALEDASFRSVLAAGDLRFADGQSVVRAAAMLGTPVPEKIAGIDLGRRLLETVDQPVYLFGGKPGIAGEAAVRLQADIPSLRIAGVHNGYARTTEAEQQDVLASIRKSGAEIVFVCLGSPAQEEWIVQNRSALPDVRLFMGLGGSLDVWAGRDRRAPRLFISLGLEWLWRLMRHPRRLGRMTAIPRFLSAVRREAKTKKQREDRV